MLIVTLLYFEWLNATHLETFGKYLESLNTNLTYISILSASNYRNLINDNTNELVVPAMNTHIVANINYYDSGK